MYFIRKASARELESLPGIEEAAGMAFLDTPYAALIHHPNASAHIDCSRDHVWVTTHSDKPVAFVIARDSPGAVHIQELHVHPHFARQRLGQALINHVADWARERCVSALTLTTFADVPWNGPYYSRLGFATLEGHELSEYLRETLQKEAAAGFPMESRIAMMLLLPRPARKSRDGLLL
jgi:GNAT superfamily N-acetyltransferase